MRSKTLVLISALLICFLISNSPLLAQSRDRDNPTPLRSKVISGLTSPGGTFWYKLTAGPGELVIDMSVGGVGSVANPYTGGSARFFLYNRDMQEVMYESISGGSDRPASKKKSLKLQSKQDFVLRIGLGGGSGTYMIRFKGAIDLPPKENEEKDD